MKKIQPQENRGKKKENSVKKKWSLFSKKNKKLSKNELNKDAKEGSKKESSVKKKWTLFSKKNKKLSKKELNNNVKEDSKKEPSVKKKWTPFNKKNKKLSKKELNKKERKVSKKSPIKWAKDNFSVLKYSPKKVSMQFRILVITVAAAIEVLGLELFIHNAGLYTGGLRSAQQIVLYGLRATNIAILNESWFSYIVFFMLNVPIAIFSIKIIGKKFTLLSMYFLSIQSLFAYILTYGASGFKTPDTSWMDGFLTRVKGNEGNNFEYISAFMGGVIYSVGVGLVFNAGASSAGTKFVIAYISHKKRQSIGKVTIYVAIVMITSGVIINNWIVPSAQSGQWTGKLLQEAIFSKKTFASFMLIGIHGMLSNVFVPRAKKTVFTIQTSNIEKVKKVILGTILAERTWYTFRIKKNIDKKDSSIVVLTVDKREEDYVLRRLHKLLPKALITYHSVNVKQDGFKVRGFD